MPVRNGVTVAFGSVWVTGAHKDQLYRIDAATNNLVATINIGAGPVFITAGFGSIWVIELRDGVVQRIDPETNTAIATIATGGHKGGDIITGGGCVWASYHDGLPLVQINPKTNQAQIYAGTGFGDALAFGAGSIWISGRTIARISPPTWR
jgi:virginiamycin B lyase